MFRYIIQNVHSEYSKYEQKKFQNNIPDSAYLYTQLAAVIIDDAERMEHPHMCIPYNRTEHMNGTNDSSALCPPAMRFDTDGIVPISSTELVYKSYLKYSKWKFNGFE